MARTPRKSLYALKDIASNDTEATVDDVTLVKQGPAVELTADQVERLKATGQTLEEVEAKTETETGGDS